VPYESERVVRIRADRDGPLLVEGPVEVTGPDGDTVVSRRFVVAICTCRRSRTYPWCDTSHRRRGKSADDRAAARGTAVDDGAPERGTPTAGGPPGCGTPAHGEAPGCRAVADDDHGAEPGKTPDRPDQGPGRKETCA
jgi:CDGSH-type Zn-finger protein